jgi:hypothetical protein
MSMDNVRMQIPLGLTAPNVRAADSEAG